MTLDEVFAYIHKVDWRGSIPGLSRIDGLLDKLGHPERQMKYVHVTGTNGKGSTCAMVSSILRKAGYKTGLYTSPYIRRFHERMQINGQPISDGDLCALVEKIRPLADSMDDSPTEFELVTAIAFTWFASQKCDIVVCEVGMGGEFDATNVIPSPEIAALCAIGLDHTAVLGDTIEKIAATKSGIIKSGCRAVLYPAEKSVEDIVRRRCETESVPLDVVDLSHLTPLSHSLEGQVFRWRSLDDLRLPLLGSHQLRNAATALTIIEAMRQRGWHITDTHIRAGLAATEWMGRFQVLHRQPLIVLDGGHNPQCMAALTENIRDYLPHRPLTVLTGVLGDKDFGRMYDGLAPLTARFVTVTPQNPRALPAEELAALLSRYSRPVTACSSIPEGISTALAQTPAEGAILVCGSLYLLGDVMDALDA